MRVRTTQRDQITVVIVEEEEPLQLRARGRLEERPVRLGLLISQKLHRHEADRSQRRHPLDDLSVNLSKAAERCASRPRSIAPGIPVRQLLTPCEARGFRKTEVCSARTRGSVTCAIVGGIIAARVGTDGIPAGWRAASEALPEWVAESELGEDLTRTALGDQVTPLRRPESIPVPRLEWTPGQWQRVPHGVRSLSMEEKWDAYLEGDQLSLHRSWTGHGVFRVTVAEGAGGRRPVAAWVESDPDLYRRGGDESESAFLELFLRAWYMDDTRPELWERYNGLRPAEAAGDAGQ